MAGLWVGGAGSRTSHTRREPTRIGGAAVAPGEPKALDLSGRDPIIADGQHAAVTNGSSDHLPWEIPQFPPYASFLLQERIHTQGD
jgi:hypothetical protein